MEEDAVVPRYLQKPRALLGQGQQLSTFPARQDFFPRASTIRLLSERLVLFLRQGNRKELAPARAGFPEEERGGFPRWNMHARTCERMRRSVCRTERKLGL